ncbi:MAG: bifunctional 2-keto-4-hydroxyglutarate aldolase/2-keto-3-deoxy-6-phosphogluconate aldolase, partial [Bifidobacteriaceae bacterium]|nr:bifunctional 2-keto-4-hydroxyglutarate aldolase/2-keto-3-deoxy-6-phosphogluconate aldolase [Bifidobacteriaceae bacterium]
MKKFETIKALKSAGVIAVVSGKSVEETEKIIDALIKGGIKGIEITFRMDDADVIIKNVSRKYADKYDIVIGAGTVLDSTTARVAILAGAKYVVSPGFDAEIAKICNLYKVPYLPGCLTITE